MKTALMTLILISANMVLAATPAKTFTYSYKPAKGQTFQIKKVATSEKEAFKMAATECFQKLTQGKYPGEDKGLEIIDICANPKM